MTTPDCVLTPELDRGCNTSTSTSCAATSPKGGRGFAYDLAVVAGRESCDPIEDATVDVWHCDAEGVYSGVEGDGTFLRGVQVADGTGTATFRTIFPGWYSAAPSTST